ncbi:MAG: vitamin B12 dependent-methionine synthase activation domain-containing protein [Prosthecobacter sp.]
MSSSAGRRSSTWGLRGRWIAAENRFSSAHEDAEMKVKAEEEAAKLFKNANDLFDRVIAEKRFTPRGVFGFFPANSIGDDIEVYADNTQQSEDRLPHVAPAGDQEGHAELRAQRLHCAEGQWSCRLHRRIRRRHSRSRRLRA